MREDFEGHAEVFAVLEGLAYMHDVHAIVLIGFLDVAKDTELDFGLAVRGLLIFDNFQGN